MNCWWTESCIIFKNWKFHRVKSVKWRSRTFWKRLIYIKSSIVSQGFLKFLKLTQLQTSLLQYRLCLAVGDICICFIKFLTSLSALLTQLVKIFIISSVNDRNKISTWLVEVFISLPGLPKDRNMFDRLWLCSQFTKTAQWWLMK